MEDFIERAFDPTSKPKNYFEFYVGKPGRGGNKRTLHSYAKYWGKEIPKEYKDRQNEYFYASDASKILDE
ncbi:hypothetical protein MKZ23_31220 [Paenibacillus sp. FSL R5-0876]|uniref:hypothetical protein n=1 Tax=Paenibacillus TaxID=44249 RepID=UPI00096DE658|nr:hypothetical protein [Paenibacillus odorifer]OME30604.1 hypothetical protein BSK63_17065 [Paenibacillus odorifer]